MEFLGEDIIILFINVIGLFLALWVYFSDRKQKLNQLFAFLVILTITWVNFGRFANLVKEIEFAFLLIKLTFAIAAFWFSIYYYFVENISTGKNRNYLLDKAVLLIGSTLSLVTISTNFVIKDVTFEQWGVNPILGEGRMFFYSIIAGLTILIIIRLIQKYLSAVGKDKLKIQYFLIGTLIYATFNLFFNVLLPAIRESYQYYQFGNYSIIFLLIFTAYAIVKRQLFGIKVILTTLLVTLISILLLLNTILFTESLPFQILKGIIFFIFLFFGYYLIRSVQLEIKRREELEELTFRLEKVNVELATAYKKLERLDKAKTEFLSIASHQLRTPLTAVKGYISMMIEKIYGKLPQKMEKPLKNIYDSNERLIKLVNGLLNISRIEAGKLEMDIKELSVEKMINDIIKELDRVVKEKNIYLKLEETKESLPLISVDEEKIRQAITNIIDNAIKYTGKGGVTIKIQVIDQKIQIIITDTGEGMSQDEISNLFVSFTRGKAGNKLWTEGAGLGLYIAKKFVEIHNGKVWAESQGKSHGSIFYIELPIKSTLNI